LTRQVDVVTSGKRIFSDKCCIHAIRVGNDFNDCYIYGTVINDVIITLEQKSAPQTPSLSISGVHPPHHSTLSPLSLPFCIRRFLLD
jgi:hypothetical protein